MDYRDGPIEISVLGQFRPRPSLRQRTSPSRNYLARFSTGVRSVSVPPATGRRDLTSPMKYDVEERLSVSTCHGHVKRRYQWYCGDALVACM